MDTKKEIIHFRDMTREQLIDLVSDMGWYALDLAQDLRMTMYAKPEYIQKMVERDCEMAYNLTHFWELDFETGNVNCVMISGNGLESSYFNLENDIK